MDKISALLKQGGVSDPLCEAIVAAMNEFKESTLKAANADALAKIELAKKVCLEEANNHKKELSRRVQIWCEAQANRVDRKLTQQSAMRESEAVTKLERLKALLEGIDVNGGTNGELQSEVKKLRGELKVATESAKQAQSALARQSLLAENTLKKNRQLETQVKTLAESRQPRTAATTRLPARNAGTPVSTRRTLVENQTRVAPKREREAGNEWDIDSIAKHVD